MLTVRRATLLFRAAAAILLAFAVVSMGLSEAHGASMGPSMVDGASTSLAHLPLPTLVEASEPAVDSAVEMPDFSAVGIDAIAGVVKSFDVVARDPSFPGAALVATVVMMIACLAIMPTRARLLAAWSSAVEVSRSRHNRSVPRLRTNGVTRRSTLSLISLGISRT